MSNHPIRETGRLKISIQGEKYTFLMEETENGFLYNEIGGNIEVWYDSKGDCFFEKRNGNLKKIEETTGMSPRVIKIYKEDARRNSEDAKAASYSVFESILVEESKREDSQLNSSGLELRIFLAPFHDTWSDEVINDFISEN